jgi:hypothetical protein
VPWSFGRVDVDVAADLGSGHDGCLVDTALLDHRDCAVRRGRSGDGADAGSQREAGEGEDGFHYRRGVLVVSLLR